MKTTSSENYGLLKQTGHCHENSYEQPHQLLVYLVVVMGAEETNS